MDMQLTLSDDQLAKIAEATSKLLQEKTPEGQVLQLAATQRTVEELIRQMTADSAAKCAAFSAVFSDLEAYLKRARIMLEDFRQVRMSLGSEVSQIKGLLKDVPNEPQIALVMRRLRELREIANDRTVMAVALAMQSGDAP